MKKRPAGLTVFAVLNFLFSGLTLVGLLVFMALPALRQEAGTMLSGYTVVSTLLLSVLLVVSGIGFLKLSYRAGFQTGVAFCVFSLMNVFIFSVLLGLEVVGSQMPTVIYSVVLLLMLKLKYRHVFLPAEPGATEQGA